MLKDRFSFLRAESAHAALAFGLALLCGSPALAQDQQEPEAPPSDEIVVTGTLIRGAPLVGSNVIAVGQEQFQETGAITSNELLGSIPQVSNYFNKVPSTDLTIAVNQIQIARPNLRNISPVAATSSATLILVDGHRVASLGVRQASVDPDLIPTGAIERVEVVTEGGSATYGADAVAGVINFITRRRFDGVKVDATYGIADDYWQASANATVGKDWGSGSLYASYTFSKNDALFGRDRDFIRGLDYSKQPYVPLDRQCDAPNVTISTVASTPFGVFPVPGSTVNFASPGLAPNTFNACDNSENAARVPASERHGAVVGLSQDLDDTTTVDVRAFYSRRESRSGGTMTGTVTITPNNPYFIRPAAAPPSPPPGFGLAQVQTVAFNFAPLLGTLSAPSGTQSQEWGANAEFKKKLGGDWQVRGLFNYSRSDTTFFTVSANPSRLAAAGAGSTTATAINPYNISATNPALIADLIDNELAGEAKDDLLNVRAIAEGPLFEIGGGAIRLAVGYEFLRDTLQQRYKADIRRGTLGTFPFDQYSRHAHALFGELQIPLFGDNNATPGIRSFVISASGRYDHYSDFGGTFNPKIGVTYKPVDWVAVRGNWGTSFTAPTPLDQLNSLSSTLDAFQFAAFVRPGDVLPGGITCCITLALQGSRPNLQPQTADTWSIGLDLDPPFLSGLHASINYYNVKFENILSVPTSTPAIFTDFPDNVITSLTGLTSAQINALRGLAANANNTINSLPPGKPVYEFVDFRTGNFGILKVSGLDFTVNYRHDVSFGSIDLSASGTYELTRSQQVSPKAPVINLVGNETGSGGGNSGRFQLQTSAGATIGALRAQATWNHSSGYQLRAPTTSVPVQTAVGSFDTVNLFFKYDVPGDSALLKDLSFTLNVNNVFDKNPPVLLRNNFAEYGYANGFTLGRMFIIGASKKF